MPTTTHTAQPLEFARTENLMTVARPKLVRILPGGVVVMLLTWSIAWCAARMLIVKQNLDHSDAIVVLAGAATYAERILHAAKLFNEGRASRIVLTDDHQRAAWSQAKQSNPFFVEWGSEELQRQGVPPKNIEIISPAHLGTQYEAERIRQYVESEKLSSIVIVTSAYHSRRALALVQSSLRNSKVIVGMDPVGTGQQTPPPATWWLHARGWQMVGGEYLKLVYYALQK